MSLSFEYEARSESKHFQVANIAKRHDRAGHSGLAYAPKPKTEPYRGTFRQDNTFSATLVKETMADADKDRFEEELIERERFMDAKHNLAGKRDVSEFEDRSVLKFDPLESLKETETGYATYDGGRFQSGTSDNTFMNGGEALLGRGRFTTLERQDPFQVKLSQNIKIKQ